MVNLIGLINDLWLPKKTKKDRIQPQRERIVQCYLGLVSYVPPWITGAKFNPLLVEGCRQVFSMIPNP